VIGNAARPVVDPVRVCNPGDLPTLAPGTVLVSIYEYLPGDPLNSLTHNETVLPRLGPRPVDFTTEPGTGGECTIDAAGRIVLSGGPGSRNHFREFDFTDNGRSFAVRVVSTDDPSQELLRDAFRVLNTLKVVPASSAG
jgi:hypothetical protein